MIQTASVSSLHERVALITGSISGIGRGIADHFGSLGARIVIHGPDDVEARKAAEELPVPVEVDICRIVVRFAVERYGGVDVLVNNAPTTARASLETASVEFWDRMMAVNLRAPFVCLQEAVTLMKTRGGRSIINI